MHLHINHAKGLAAEIVARGISHKDMGSYIVVDTKVFILKRSSEIFENDMSITVADDRTKPYRHVWSRRMTDEYSKVFRHDKPM